MLLEHRSEHGFIPKSLSRPEKGVLISTAVSGVITLELKIGLLILVQNSSEEVSYSMILCYMHVFFTALATSSSSGSADCYDAKSSSRIITIAFFHFLMAQQRSLALDLICARLPSIILLLLLHDARLQQWKRRSKRHTVAAVVNSKDVTTIMITLGYTDIHYFE